MMQAVVHSVYASTEGEEGTEFYLLVMMSDRAVSWTRMYSNEFMRTVKAVTGSWAMCSCSGVPTGALSLRLLSLRLCLREAAKKHIQQIWKSFGCR